MPLDKQNFNYSIPLSASTLSSDSGLIVGDTTSSQTVSGKILYSVTGTTYIPVALSTVSVPGALYQPTAPVNPGVGQIWIDSSSSNTSFDPNIIRRKTFTATGGQTVFIADYAFTDGYEEVYLNGLLLVRNVDYTTTNSIQVNLNTATVVNDIVEIIAVTNLNSVSGSTATTTTNTFTGPQTFIPSNGALTPITINGAFNQTADLLDIKNYSGTSLLAINSSGNVGINQQYPSVPLDVVGNSTIARFIGINSTYQGFAVQNNYASSTVYGAAFFDARNESGSAVANFLADINTDGSSAWSWATQPLGTRTDRRVERMRITSDGRITFNTTAYGNLNPGNYAFDFTNAGNWLKGAITTTGSYGGPISMLDGSAGWNLRTQASGTEWHFAYGTTTSGLTEAMMLTTANSGSLLIGYTSSVGSYKLQVNGSSYLLNGYSTSDKKYKKNIKPISGGIDIVKALKPVEFDWIQQKHITDKDGKVLREKHEFPEHKNVGFIAQDVQEVLKGKDWLKNIVSENTREAIKDENGKIVVEEESYLAVSEMKLVPVLVQAIQELTARLEKVEGKK